MRNLRLIATATVAASAIFTASAGAVPPKYSDCTFVRGVTTDDAHTNEIGKGHTLHGNGWGYGHGCGDTSGGGDTGGDTGVSMA